MSQEVRQAAEQETHPHSTTLITLPKIVDGETPFLSVAQENFSEHAFLENWKLLKPILQSIQPDQDFVDPTRRADFIVKRDLLLQAVEPSISFIPELASSADVKDVTLLMRPNAVRLESSTPIELSTLQSELEHTFSNSQGNAVVLSPSHVSTYAEIHAALNSSKESGLLLEQGKLGVIIFDEHTDFYRDSSTGVPAVSQGVQPDTSSMNHDQRLRAISWYRAGVRTAEPLPVTKGNFLIHLLEEKAIDSVCIIGPSEHLVKHATVPYYGKDATYDYFIDRTDRIHIVGFSTFKNNENGALERKEYLERIMAEIKAMKNNGVTHLVFSVDLDVLQSEIGYTGFDYNSYVFLMNLGLQNIHQQVEELEETVRQFNLNHRARALHVAKLLDAVIFERKHPLKPNLQIGKMKPKLPGGLPAGFIGQVIDAIKEFASSEDMTIGIQLPNGQYVGDVVELQGNDLRGNTTKIAIALAERIAR